uniref:ABM domain-containing protein n=1 Tax=Ascaris lumbricoides TaxID=6252 RepID=A0A0M3HR74_ASCLU
MHTCKARNHIKEHTQFWNKFLVDWETSDYLQVKGAHCFIAFTKSEGTEKEVAIDTHIWKEDADRQKQYGQIQMYNHATAAAVNNFEVSIDNGHI